MNLHNAQARCLSWRTMTAAMTLVKACCATLSCSIDLWPFFDSHTMELTQELLLNPTYPMSQHDCMPGEAAASVKATLGVKKHNLHMFTL